MKAIIKYQVEKPFKDRFTKEEITKNKILDISIERMKELNEHNIGKVIDVIVMEDYKIVNNVTDNKSSNDKEEKYTKEELCKLSVNDLKDLAEKMHIELTKAKKDEIIEEILENQNN